MTDIKVVFSGVVREDEAKSFADRHGYSFEGYLQEGEEKNLPDSYVLVFTSKTIYLTSTKEKQSLRVEADFVSGSVAHRRQFGGGKGQQIAKAVGLTKGFLPKILDATAGLGKDAFVLASLGATLTLLERSPIVHALLSEGLKQARLFAEENADEVLMGILQRMKLIELDSTEFLSKEQESFDVVYLDPMFPERKKSALVKKEMRVFHEVVGSDLDADALLAPAIENAEYRVVVKRPRIAPDLAGSKPSYRLEGKSSRFDVYTKKALPV